MALFLYERDFQTDRSLAPIVLWLVSNSWKEVMYETGKQELSQQPQGKMNTINKIELDISIKYHWLYHIYGGSKRQRSSYKFEFFQFYSAFCKNFAT